MSESLKPCPFCGGNAMFLTITNKSSHSAVGVMFKIKCMNAEQNFQKAMNVRCIWIRTVESEQEKTSEQKQLQIGTGGQTMRLIDADALVKRLEKSHEYHAKTSIEEVLLFRDIRIINEQPTAYDLDKVVEQLKEFQGEMEQFSCDGILTDMIEIVKRGGVDAD